MKEVKSEYVAYGGNSGNYSYDQMQIPPEAREMYSKAKRAARPQRRDVGYYDTPDAPAYEGPNSTGPNRADYKREHPLTALDLERIKKAKKSRM